MQKRETGQTLECDHNYTHLYLSNHAYLLFPSFVFRLISHSYSDLSAQFAFLDRLKRHLRTNRRDRIVDIFSGHC